MDQNGRHQRPGGKYNDLVIKLEMVCYTVYTPLLQHVTQNGDIARDYPTIQNGRVNLEVNEWFICLLQVAKIE